MTVYPNQKIIHINKQKYTNDFLTIGISEWISTSKDLAPNTFKLYLYLASNADGFDLTLSRQDVMDKLNVSKDSYLRAIKELEDKQYITLLQGNVYNFYTTPNGGKNATSNNLIVAKMQPVCMQNCDHDGSKNATSMVAPVHTEINKTNITDTLNSERDDANAKEEKGNINDNTRTIQNLTIDEGDAICRRIRKEPYIALQKEYKLKDRITSDFPKEWKEEKNRRGEEAAKEYEDANPIVRIPAAILDDAANRTMTSRKKEGDEEKERLGGKSIFEMSEEMFEIDENDTTILSDKDTLSSLKLIETLNQMKSII